MHDIKDIRAAVEDFRARLATREDKLDLSTLIELDEQRRKLVQLTNDTQNFRKRLAILVSSSAQNSISGQEIRTLNSRLATSEIDFSFPQEADTRQLAVACKQLSKVLQQRLDIIQQALLRELEEIPNLPDPSLPQVEPKVCKTWGAPRVSEELPRHFDLCPEQFGFAVASRLAGSKFSYLTGQLASLERAIINFMLDLQIQNGFQLTSPPLLLKSKAMYNSGHLPKFAQELFVTTDENWLLPTAESALVNLHSEETLELRNLPRRYVAMTPCFRREAGAAGKDTRGIIRQHQFYKVELVAFTSAEQAEAELDKIVASAEQVLEQLELPYQRVLLPANDLGFAAAKTYDLEVYMAGEQVYREISSCSWCSDFQARRAKIFYKDATGNKRLAHTLNGSGLAVGRTIAAILEHYQEDDRSVLVPQVLIPYLNGLRVINTS